MAKEKLIFISHKQRDHDIAVVLANFIKNKSQGQTKGHLSFEPDFEGPRIGTNTMLGPEKMIPFWVDAGYQFTYKSLKF